MAGCQRGRETKKAPEVVADTTRARDSIPDERPDSTRSTPPDSMTTTLGLLPAAPGGALDGEAAAMAERAVFLPRTQRWFLARSIDSVLAMDIGRIDGGVGTTDVSRQAFQRMIGSRSPIQPGLSFVMHDSRGARPVKVSGFRLSGRRIVATLAMTPSESGPAVVPVEWRGESGGAVVATVPPCAAGDETAIASALTRYVPVAEEALTVLRGCFGAFRALIVIRPLVITPTSAAERVILVRTTGTTRAGKLRDLSYPLHALQSVVDVNGDGTDEILVRSFRPAMETWAALRMTDSVTFTRFASGFTIEKR